MNFFNCFNISWGLEDNVQEAILALDLPPVDVSNGFVDTTPGNLETCPLCENKLGLTAPAISAIKSGDDTFVFDKNMKKKIKYHCAKFHPFSLLWPIIEGSHKIRGNQISVLFLAQKLISAASKLHVLSCHSNVQLYFTAVFGVAIGLMAEYRSSKVIGTSAEERDSFLKKVEELLEKLMFACMRFDWNKLLSLHSNKFKSLNFVKHFCRLGLFFTPKFPAFSNVDLESSLNTLCNYKQRSAALLNAPALEEPYHEEEEDQHLLHIDIGWESIEEPEINVDAEVSEDTMDAEVLEDNMDAEVLGDNMDAEDLEDNMDAEVLEDNIQVETEHDNNNPIEVPVETEHDNNNPIEVPVETEHDNNNPIEVPVEPEYDSNNPIETASNISVDALKEVYSTLFSKNRHLVSTGKSTYGEITKGGVEKFIEAIKEYFLKHLKTPQQRKNFRMLDVGGGLMTTITHIAQEIDGYYCGIEYCPDRCKLFCLSFQKLLGKNVLKNANIAYKWGNIMDITHFDFDLVYSFDETMKRDHWDHMLTVFEHSPRCKFLITFKPLKDVAGNTDEFVLMRERHKLKYLADIKVVMKCKPEVCHAGFFIKQHLEGSPKGAGKFLYKKSSCMDIFT
jgi:hypothetical protein